MSKPSESQTRSPGLVLALVLVLVVSASSFLSWRQAVRASEGTRRTLALMSAQKDLQAGLLDAESSERGFLLTRDPSYLHEYKEALAMIDRRVELLDSFKSEFSTHPNILEPYHRAVSIKRQQLNTFASQCSSVTGEDYCSPLSQVQRGQAVMQKLRAIDKQMASHLAFLLSQTREQTRFYGMLSQWVSTLGAAGIFTIVLLSQLKIGRLLSARTKLNVELAQANSDLKQFVYSGSHDLQEPLRMLMVYSELVERKVQADLPVSKELHYLRTAAEQMSMLLNDLLTYTQMISAPNDVNQPSDLNQTVPNVLKALHVSADETAAQITWGKLPVLSISNTHAHQLFQNLIGNAIKYRKADTTPQIQISAERDLPEWIISVKDNGMGVDPVYHQQIFGIFKRLHKNANYPGTGLGLAICKKIVERYGGSIWVESQLDRGSTFKFSIPDINASYKKS